MKKISWINYNCTRKTFPVSKIKNTNVQRALNILVELLNKDE